MLTLTRRPLTGKELAECRSELKLADKTLAAEEQSAKLNARLVPAVRSGWLIFAMLAVVGYRTDSDELLTAGVVLSLVTFYAAVASFFRKPNHRLLAARRRQEELKELVDHGVFVERRVTSLRYFRLDAFDDESPEYYFDLGDEGTLVILEYEIDDHWKPNTDFRLTCLETPNGQRFREKVSGTGQRLSPMEVISRADLAEGDYEHLEIVPGHFEDLLKEMRNKAEP